MSNQSQAEGTQDALMVPMAVEALVVNPYVRKWPTTLWRRFTPDWDGFATSGTPPFDSSGYTTLDASNDGVYLHWAIPKAFTSASIPDPDKATSAHQSIVFPLAPNRWLVMRVGPLPQGTNSRPLTAWVIQSDYLVKEGSSAKPGSSPYVQPFSSTVGNLVPATIGTNIPIESYTGDLASEAQDLFLTAAGPGDVSFAAWQPGVTDVFSFFDSSIASANSVAGNYDYIVMGWFSDPAKDPLASATDATWTALLKSLQWSVLDGPNAPGQTTPAAASITVCHGSVVGVAWPGESPATGPNSSAPDATKLTVVVGSTTLDALCTGIQTAVDSSGGTGPSSKGTIYEEHLQALMAGMLPSVGTAAGLQRVREAVERGRFGAASGGATWTVVPASIDGMPTNSAPPSLTPSQQAALDALNQQQMLFDALSRELAAAQMSLYGTWWKNFQTQYLKSPPEEIGASDWNTVLSYLASQLPPNGEQYTSTSALQLKANSLAAALDKAQAEMTQSLGQSLVLKAAPLPRYYQPRDPAVLVQGLPPGSKYAGNGSYANGCLTCRFSSQIVAGIQLNSTLQITAAQAGAALQVPFNSALPKNILPLGQALCGETFFLNPANAPPLAQQIGSGVDPGTLRVAMTSPADQLGTAPAPIGLLTWQQPFTPLYLEWTVQFVYTPESEMQSWTFDGSDYTFSGTVDATHNSYSGRSLLTPHAADLFRLRVQKYVQAAGPSADPALQQVLNLLNPPSTPGSPPTLDSPDMMAQTLGGLGSMLLLLDPSPNYPPDKSVAPVVDYQFHAVPYTNYLTDVDPRGGTYFFPVRAGWFRFTRLDVLDCFGQALDLLRGNADDFSPLISPELAVDANTKLNGLGQPANWIRLPPRIQQLARLRLTLLPAATGAPPNSNPLHGWLVPNHLDLSISIYDGSGILLGEVMALLDPETGEATTAQWQPAPQPPGAPVPPATPADIADTTLRGVVEGLIAASGDKAAFQDFLDVIDETQWTIDPLGGRADQNLSVLMGMPLAVVSLQITLDLSGGPAQDQSFTNTLNLANGHPPNSANLLVQPFTIRLGDLQRGDDGVIGYFEPDFSAFNSIIAPAAVDAGAPASHYIQAIGIGNFLNVTCGDTGAMTVPLLIDPRGGIHAVSGIQPVSTINVPSQFVTNAERAMRVVFRTGPLLTDPATIRMPRPAENNGAWMWVGNQAGTYSLQPVIAASDTARLSDPTGVSEGWLQFTPNDVG